MIQAKNYKNEIEDEEKLFVKFKKSKDYDKYVNSTEDVLYPKGKVRKFNYATTSTPTNDQKTGLQYLSATVNPKPEEKTFTNKVKFD